MCAGTGTWLWPRLLSVALATGCAGAVQPAPVAPPAPATEVETRLYLIGDAGNPSPRGEPVLQALSRQLGEAPGKSFVVYLGDNVYPAGLPDTGAPDRPEAERRLDAQLEAVRVAGVKALFLPGNHDWSRPGDQGWAAIRREGQYLDRQGAPLATLLPRDGCPGPTVTDLGRRLRLVVLDTQWWLQPGAKPRDPVSECPADSEPEIVDSLRAALRGAGGRQVIVVAHHPLETGGTHGGHFLWTDHLFPLRQLSPVLWIPLPVLGSIYPLARRWGASPQDISNGANRRMRNALEEAFAGHQPLVYASGHDHNLQVLDGENGKYLLVSGAGIFGHTGPVSRHPHTRYALAASGFMRLDVLESGRVRLGVFQVDRSGSATERYSAWLE